MHVFPFWTAYFFRLDCIFWLDCTLKLYWVTNIATNALQRTKNSTQYYKRNDTGLTENVANLPRKK